MLFLIAHVGLAAIFDFVQQFLVQWRFAEEIGQVPIMMVVVESTMTVVLVVITIVSLAVRLENGVVPFRHDPQHPLGGILTAANRVGSVRFEILNHFVAIPAERPVVHDLAAALEQKQVVLQRKKGITNS